MSSAPLPSLRPLVPPNPAALIAALLLTGLGACGPVYRAAAASAPVGCGRADAAVREALRGPQSEGQLSRAWRSSAQ